MAAAWLQLSQHDGAADLRPQQVYAAQQWRRLSPNPSAAGDYQGAIGALALGDPSSRLASSIAMASL
ncbi:MAG: hypothetical protein VKM34_05225 [Cyanobacteriota bacterium]|nr:hypothetical protein [Cyanobacteriota bacterium]